MATVTVGLDIGTTAIKAAAYRADGTQIAMADCPSRTESHAGGRSEQDMDAVWQTVCQVLRRLATDLTDHRIAALGICAQGDGLWAVDANSRPVGPAMLWNDTRAADDLAALERSGATKAVARASRTALWPGTSGMLWRSMSDSDKARTAHVLTCGDWIGLKLTGAVATDFANATIPFLDLDTRAYCPKALAALDCADLAERLATPRAADSRLGTLGADAARATGLPEGLSVSVPTLDLTAMILGMGLDRPGQTMMVMGTTAVANILTDGVAASDTAVAASVAHPTSPATVRVLAPTTGAAAFDWFAGLHPQSLGGETAGAVAAKLNALVSDVPPGANGVTFLPYLNGERAPFVAPRLTAAFHGLTARSTKADMGRAVMEGAAMSLRHCLAMEGTRPKGPVTLTGGGARNPVLSQIIADVVCTPIEVTEASDHGLWGAACLGGAAAGLGEIMTLAARAVPTVGYAPDPAASAAYARVFNCYMALSDAARAFQRAAGDGTADTTDDKGATP